MKFGIKKFKLKKKENSDLKLKKIEPEDTTPVIEQPINDGIDLNMEYARLQEEYTKTPTEELGLKIMDIYNKLYANPKETNSDTVETQTEPLDIPDTVPDNVNLDQEETKYLSIAKEEDDKLKIELERKRKAEEERKKREEEYRTNIAQVDLDEHLERLDQTKEVTEYVEKQKAKQPEIQLRRLKERELMPNREEVALEEFCKLMNYTDAEKVTVDYPNSLAEEDELLETPKYLEDGDGALSTISDKSLDQIINNKIQHPEETPDLVAQEVLEIDMPDDLDPQIKQIWHVIPKESKLEIIRKHKEEQKPKEIPDKKKSIFGKKINFRKKKQELKQQPDLPKKKSFLDIFKKKKEPSLKNVEAYCHSCKHGIMAHQYKGRSTGCRECGCLITIQKILEVNKINFNVKKEKEDLDNGHICTCGHRQIVHPNDLFCEEKDCYCIEFKDKDEFKD